MSNFHIRKHNDEEQRAVLGVKEREQHNYSYNAEKKAPY